MTQPPRQILFVLTGLGVGGGERLVVALAQKFQFLGSKVSVVTLIEPGPLKAELTRAGIPVESLGMMRRIPAPTSLWRLAKIVRREKPDVVNSHMFHANILARVSRLFWKHVPLICTVHNVNEVSARSANFEAQTWRDTAYRLTNFLAQKNTAVSEAAVHRYVTVRAFRPEQIEAVPNGIVVSRFARDAEAGAALRKELGLDGKIVGVMVARMEAPKDHALLLRAAAGVLKTRPNLRIVFVGDGPNGASLKDLARSLGISDSVTFAGIRKDVPAFLSMADFFLLVTNMEGMPISILEAGAASLPAIASAAGGVPETIVDGKTGLLVRPGDQRELENALEKMFSLSSTERAAMGEAARTNVIARYDFEIMTANYLRVYNDAIAALHKH